VERLRADPGELLELVPRPPSGRVFERSRSVRVTDTRIDGTLRLDGAVRFMQDVANDDAHDAAAPDPTAWVARRTLVRAERMPRYLDQLTMTTWCSGVGPRWAERRYSFATAGERGLEAATVWVHVDLATMRPLALPAGFAEEYGLSAGGRKVSARLVLDPVPPADAVAHPWPLRVTDFDVLGHVNNSAYWAIVEQHRATTDGPLHVLLEHHDAIDPGDEVTVHVRRRADRTDMWITGPRGTVAVVRMDGVV
jgi:acyl-ACP thioesterase